MLAGLAGHWYRVSALTRVLAPLSLLFGLVVAMRRLLFRARILSSARIGIPVIVVGNITAGGSGKTPVVLWVAKYLASQGWQPERRDKSIGSSPTSFGSETSVTATGASRDAARRPP